MLDILGENFVNSNNNTEKLILPAVEDSKQLDNTELDKLWMNMEFHTSSRMAPVEEILVQNYHLLTLHSKLYWQLDFWQVGDVI